MKQCGKCKSVLDAEMFGKCSASKDGLLWMCKKCKKSYSASYYQKNKSMIIESVKRWAADNYDKKLEINNKWIYKNKEYCYEIARSWRRSNKHLANQLSANRRMISKNATPKWADKFIISEIYHLASLRTTATGFKWHVDHVIPLKGKNVCGLHVETNLQVIPWIDNVRKGNRF